MAAVNEWYAVFVRGRKEEFVHDLLNRMGYDVFLPRRSQRVIRGGRSRSVDRPLFPNYLFVETDLARDHRLTIVRIPEVLRILGYGDRPSPIPREQIESLQTMVRQQAPLASFPYLECGQKVRITEGPFRNVVGILVERRGESRLVISVDLVGRAVSMSVDRAYVEPYY